MMVDVDGLTRQFGSSVAQHLCIAALLHKIDVANKLNAYDSIIGDSKNVAQLDPSSHYHTVSISVLIAHVITSTATNSIDISSTAITTTSTPIIPPVVSSICSVPILLYHTSPVDCHITSLEGDGSNQSATLRVASNSISTWLCIDDVCNSFC